MHVEQFLCFTPNGSFKKLAYWTTVFCGTWKGSSKTWRIERFLLLPSEQCLQHFYWSHFSCCTFKGATKTRVLSYFWLLRSWPKPQKRTCWANFALAPDREASKTGMLSHFCCCIFKNNSKDRRIVQFFAAVPSRILSFLLSRRKREFQKPAFWAIFAAWP